MLRTESSRVTLNHCQFEDILDSPVIDATESEFQVKNTTFVRCIGLYGADSTFYIYNSSFVEGKSSLYIYSGTMIIDTCYFFNNQNATHIEYGTLNISNSIFESNTMVNNMLILSYCVEYSDKCWC